MPKPKISIIIPVYNAESTIRRCLDSVVKQSFLSFTKEWNVKRVAYAGSFGLDYWEYNEDETAMI